MKSQLLSALLLTSTLAIGSISFPAAAQESSSSLQIICSKAQDPSSKKAEPATIAKVAGSSEETVLIIWKSEYFGTKFTPKHRCGIVSAKIQTAFQQGRVYIGSGIDKASGAGIICGLSKPDEMCDRRNMFFTMKSYQDAQDTIQQLSDITQGKSGVPIYQSSGGKRVNLRDLAIKGK
jgi:hypothetical protein